MRYPLRTNAEHTESQASKFVELFAHMMLVDMLPEPYPKVPAPVMAEITPILEPMLKDLAEGGFSDHYKLVSSNASYCEFMPLSEGAAVVETMLESLKCGGDPSKSAYLTAMGLKDKALECCICGGQIEIDKRSGWNQGHNAWPVVEEGRCCGNCNASVVIPARIERAKP